MEKPSTAPAKEGSTLRLTAHPQPQPVLLPLPARSTESRQGKPEAGGEPCLEELQVIETGSGPQVEAVLLKELLAQSPGLRATLADPFEAHQYQGPLAGVNAYKHRLHALRCEFVNVRLRLHEMETQLTQSNYHREVLQKHVQFLDTTLAQIRSSRAWQWTEKFSRWHRRIMHCFAHVFSTARGEASNGPTAA